MEHDDENSIYYNNNMRYRKQHRSTGSTDSTGSGGGGGSHHHHHHHNLNFNSNENRNSSSSSNQNSSFFSPRADSARKYLVHRALDTDTSQHHFDNINGMDDDFAQQTSIQFFNVSNLSQSIHKLFQANHSDNYDDNDFNNDNHNNQNNNNNKLLFFNLFKLRLSYILFFIVLLFCCLSVGPLLWLPVSNQPGCGWCNVIRLEWIIAFVGIVSSIFHFSIRRDLFTVFLAFGGFWNALYYREPYLQPYYITPFNFIMNVMFYLFIFFPKAASIRNAKPNPTLHRLFSDDDSDHNSRNRQHHHRQSNRSRSGLSHSSSSHDNDDMDHRNNSLNSENENRHNFYWTVCQMLMVFVVVLLLFISILICTVITTDHGVDNKYSTFEIAWNTLVSILYITPNQIFTINESIVRLITILFLSGLTMLYHLQIRKTYTLLSLAALMPQVAEALYLLELTMAGDNESNHDFVKQPYGGGIFYILNVISFLSFFCGLAIDIVQASGEKYTRWQAEGEILHRRLSIELNQQSDYMNRIYASGTQQLLEKFDFMQQFVERLTLNITEVSKESCRLSSSDLNKHQIKSVNTIQELTNQNINLIDDIKLILAIEAGDVSVEDVSFNIFSLIEEVFEKISKDITSNNIELVFKVNEDVPPNLIGDPSALIQILLQLLRNSVKYTEKGDIGIIVSKLEQTQQLDDNSLLDQDDVYIEISVFDNGVGMTDEQLNIINQFLPFPRLKPLDDPLDGHSNFYTSGYGMKSHRHFYEKKDHTIMEEDDNDVLSASASSIKDGSSGMDTTEDEEQQQTQKGTGLGLYICNKIIKGLGGTFVAQRNGESGSVFTMKLLFQQDNSPAPVSEDPFALSNEQSTAFNQLPVLIIDDDSNVRSSTEMILNRFGCIARSAASTVEGIRELKLAIQLDPYKVVLVDYHMPGCDGLETIQMLRDNPLFDGVKLILLLTPTDLLLKSDKTRNMTCIVKPLTPTSLIRGLSEVFHISMHVHRKKFNSVFPVKVLDSGRGRPIMRTLIGEGDFNTQNIIQNCLDTFRYHFTFVQDGATLLSMAKKNYYDLIIVNIDLAVLNGVEVAEAIRKQESQSVSSPDPTDERISLTSSNNSSSSSTSLNSSASNIVNSGSTATSSTQQPLASTINTNNSGSNIPQLQQTPISNTPKPVNKARRFSYPQLFPGSSDLIISHRRRGLLKIVGISNNHITDEQISAFKMAGMDECIEKKDITYHLNNILLEMDKQRKRMVYSPQKILSPLTEKKEDMIIMPQLSTSRISMMSTPMAPTTTTTTTTTTSTNVPNVTGPTTSSTGMVSTLGFSKSTKRVQDLQNVISRFVPIEFQQLIAPAGMEHVYLGDAISKTITIFFSDIRDFTSTTEKMLVDDVIDFLNTYLAFAIPAITDKGGFIDKFIGDAIMAIFPHSDIQEQAIAAVKAAVGMMRALDFMSESGFRFKSVETGIGINTGKTIIGIVGTETRMEPTALGDAVNLASRTEPLCKEYGSRILVTQFTIEAIGASIDEFTIRLVDSVKVKGKSEAVDIYEVIDGDRDDVRALKMSILGSFNAGIEHFKKLNYEEALSCFQNCNEIFPADKPTMIFIQRCLHELEHEIANPMSTLHGRHDIQ